MTIGLHNIDYAAQRLKVKPLTGKAGFIPEGIWLPVSCAAIYAGCSTQTVRLLYLSNQIKGLKFEDGPLLVDVRFLPSCLKRNTIGIR